MVHRPPLSKIEVGVDMLGALEIKINGDVFDYRTILGVSLSIDGKTKSPKVGFYT